MAEAFRRLGRMAPAINTSVGVFAVAGIGGGAIGAGLEAALGGGAAFGAASAAEAAGAEVSSGAMQAMERQFATAGRKSVETTIKTLTRKIAEHEVKIAEATAQGGKISSMLRENRAFQETIKAAQRVLEKNR